MPRFTLVLLFVSTIFNFTSSFEKEVTVNVDPGKEDCYYQEVKKGETVDFEYQVIDGGHGDLDITFRLFHPTGRVLNADFKKSENNHRFEATSDGDYKFCFDNTISSYNKKTIFFEIIVERDDDEWGSEENLNNDLAEEESYEIKVQDIQEVILKVHGHLSKVRHLQDTFKSYEARDRNVAEENFLIVNFFSIVQFSVMVTVGVVQVLMIRSLFLDSSSKGYKLWQGLERARLYIWKQ